MKVNCCNDDLTSLTLKLKKLLENKERNKKEKEIPSKKKNIFKEESNVCRDDSSFK